MPLVSFPEGLAGFRASSRTFADQFAEALP
jgi:hypothetical protein